MKRKKVKVILGSLFGTFLLLFIILVAHIATAKPVENAHIQVSRIDFEQPLDSALSTTVTQQLRAIPGVKSDVIVKNNVVVYFHDNTVANSQQVFDQLMQKGTYNAQRFVVPAELANAQACPVIKKDSWSYRFSSFVQGIFN